MTGLAKNLRLLHHVLAVLLLCASGSVVARAQLIGEPPLPPKQQKKQKQKVSDLEWMWQYSPPPAEGREHDFIQDPHFRPFLEQTFKAPQSFWGMQRDSPKDSQRKSLPDTIENFLTIPGAVTADDNRYLTVTGAVFHFRASRGLLFADLDNPHPLLVFAAIDWIRDGKTTDQADAEYTLWIFVNQPPGPPTEPRNLPPALTRSLTRWMAQPLPGTGFVQKITAAILVDADGTPHQIPVPGIAAIPTPATPAPVAPETPVLNKRPSFLAR